MELLPWDGPSSLANCVRDASSHTAGLSHTPFSLSSLSLSLSLPPSLSLSLSGGQKFIGITQLVFFRLSETCFRRDNFNQACVSLGVVRESPSGSRVRSSSCAPR